MGGAARERRQDLRRLPGRAPERGAANGHRHGRWRRRPGGHGEGGRLGGEPRRLPGRESPAGRAVHPGAGRAEHPGPSQQGAGARPRDLPAVRRRRHRGRPAAGGLHRRPDPDAVRSGRAGGRRQPGRGRAGAAGRADRGRGGHSRGRVRHAHRADRAGAAVAAAPAHRGRWFQPGRGAAVHAEPGRAVAGRPRPRRGRQPAGRRLPRQRGRGDGAGAPAARRGRALHAAGERRLCARGGRLLRHAGGAVGRDARGAVRAAPADGGRGERAGRGRAEPGAGLAAAQGLGARHQRRRSGADVGRRGGAGGVLDRPGRQAGAGCARAGWLLALTRQKPRGSHPQEPWRQQGGSLARPSGGHGGRPRPSARDGDQLRRHQRQCARQERAGQSDAAWLGVRQEI